LVGGAGCGAWVRAAGPAGASPSGFLGLLGWPGLAGVVGVAAVVLIRQFIVAETPLSLFGLGIPEPMPSWGIMLAAAQRPQALTETWWLLAPVAGLILVCVMYYALARVLRPGPVPTRF